MRGYLMLAAVVMIGAAVAACSQSTPKPIAQSTPAVPAPLQLDITPTYIATVSSPQPLDSVKLALESHPSFIGYIPNFLGAYTRDACLREGWDRPVTIQEPYVGDAHDLLTRELSGRLIELQDAEAKWRAIQEKHNAVPKTP